MMKQLATGRFCLFPVPGCGVRVFGSTWQGTGLFGCHLPFSGAMIWKKWRSSALIKEHDEISEEAVNFGAYTFRIV